MTKKLLIGISIGLISIFIFFNFFLERIIENKLENFVEATFENFYQLKFESNYTALNLSGFSIGFENVAVSSDTSNARLRNKLANVFFEADRFEINEIAISKLLFKSDIDISEFALTNPSLVFLVGDNQKDVEPTPEQSGKNPIKEIEIEDFRLMGGSATFLAKNHSKDTLYSGNALDIKFSALDIPLGPEGLKAQDIAIGGAEIKVENVFYDSDISAYQYKMKEMIFNYSNENLACREVKLIPKETLLSMSNEEKYQKTVFDIDLGLFELHDVNVNKLKDHGDLQAGKVTLSEAKFFLLRNANHPLEPTNKQLMHRSLLKSTFPIQVDSILIKNASIDYRLVPKGANQYGQVKLENINGLLTGIQSGQPNQDTLKLYLESSFMEHGDLTFAADFPLSDPSKHSYFGHINGLPFEDLNTIVTPLVGVQLNDGMIEDIYFTGECTDRVNTGEMIFDYDNLKMQVNDKATGKKKWLLTDLSGLIVRHKSKKDKDGRSKAVTYQYTRPEYQGHIGFYLNGLMDGIMKNLLPKPVYSRMINGLTPKTE